MSKRGKFYLKVLVPQVERIGFWDDSFFSLDIDLEEHHSDLHKTGFFYQACIVLYVEVFHLDSLEPNHKTFRD